MKGLVKISLIFLAITFLFTNFLHAQEIKIGAGAAPTENIFKPIKDPFEKATGIKLNIIASGPKIAMQDLEKGTVDAAAAGLSFQDWLELMKKEGAEVKDPASLHHVVIGKDRIVVLVHKDNPVNRLTKEQLEGIFTGAITNWKDVGGKDMPIIVVWGKLIPGTNSMFIRHILGGKSTLKEVLEATTAEDVKLNVAANPEAIGIGPVAVVDNTVKAPEIPEVSRPITFVTKGKPSPNVEKLINFIKGEGQKYIKQ